MVLLYLIISSNHDWQLSLKRRRVGALVARLVLLLLTTVKIGHSGGQVDGGAYSRGRQRRRCSKVPVIAEILGWRNDMGMLAIGASTAARGRVGGGGQADG